MKVERMCPKPKITETDYWRLQRSYNKLLRECNRLRDEKEVLFANNETHKTIIIQLKDKLDKIEELLTNKK